MSKHVSMKELRNMQPADILREVRTLRAELAKQRMGLALGKEKNSGSYKANKRQIARMLTVATEKTGESLQAKQADSTVPARAEEKAPKAASKKRSTSTKKAS